MLAAGPFSFVPSLALVPALSAGWECAKSTMSDWDTDPNPDNGYKQYGDTREACRRTVVRKPGGGGRRTDAMTGRQTNS